MTIWHGLATLAVMATSYVCKYVCMLIRMYVCRINLTPIQIVWKLNVDEFTCKTLHSRLEIGDLAMGIESTPLQANRLDLDVHTNRVNLS